MNLRIIYENKWKKGNIYAKSAEHPKHPVTDTQIDTLEMYWRHPTRSNGHPTMYASNNLGAAKEVDSIAIRGHNFDSNVVITLYGADDSAFTVNVVQRTITYYAENILAFFTAFTKQYVKVQAVNAANPADYLKQATILLGKAFAPNRNIGPGYAEGNKDLSEEEYSDSHVLFVQEKPIIDTGRYPFRGLDDATREEILKLFKEVGTHKAFIVCFDKDAPNTTSKFVKNVDLISPVFEDAIGPNANVWTWELSVKEIV